MKNSAQYPDAGDDTRSVDVSSVSDIETMGESAADSPRLSKRVRIFAVVSACVLLLTGGVSGGLAYARHVAENRRQEALAVCEGALKDFNAAVKIFDTAKSDVAETVQITEDQVADGTVVASLQNAVSIVAPAGVSCDAEGETDSLSSASQKLTGLAKDIQASAQSIVVHADQVVESKAAKDVADARAALESAISAGEQTLKDSDGKVQDNAVREQLREALDHAVKVKESTDVKLLGDNAGNVEGKSKAVADAVTAKVEADAQAAAAAAQSSAAQRTSGGASTGGQNTSGSTTRKGTTGSSTSGNSTGNTGNNNNGSNSTSNQQNTSNNGKTQNGWETDSNGTISGGSFCGTSDGKSFVPC